MDSLVEPSLVGIGLYTVAEAARLADAPSRSIRRWLRGYQYRSTGESHAVKPVWRGDLEPIDGTIALSFHDLLEAKMIAAFRRRGVTWPAIRKAAQRAQGYLESNHPFIMKGFKTDGRRIFAEVEESGEVRLFDLNMSQYTLRDIVTPSLFRGIEFDQEFPVRWYPEEGRGWIVIDPKRSFGRPIVARTGVPTEVLASAMIAEESVERVARLYDTGPEEVRIAARFERKMAG